MQAFSTMNHNDADAHEGCEPLEVACSMRSGPSAPGELDLDSTAVVATLTVMNAVLQERAEQLRTGISLRDANAGLLREYCEYVTRLTGHDVATVRPAIAAWLAKSGTTASATLLQLVVGARVYQSLGIAPTTGIFAIDGAACQEVS